MYSDKHKEFNCAQRVHQNTLEQLPFYLIGLLLGGIRHTEYAVICGALFLIGRVIYSIGYYTGNPDNRIPGAIISGIFGIIPLCFMAISTGAGIVGLW